MDGFQRAFLAKWSAAMGNWLNIGESAAMDVDEPMRDVEIESC